VRTAVCASDSEALRFRFYFRSKELPVTATPRIAPLQPPFEPALAQALERITPPGAPGPLALFRVLARHPELLDRMRVWGSLFLGKQATLPLRVREIVIDRTCARCGAQYEWGVHVAAFAEDAALTPAQVDAITDAHADPAVLPARDALLVRLVDELHDENDVGDALWHELAQTWDERQLIELVMLCGWYHAISFVCVAARVPLEPWARRWEGR
jgi:4-carboxymuconolactone decarboxylase